MLKVKTLIFFLCTTSSFYAQQVSLNTNKSLSEQWGFNDSSKQKNRFFSISQYKPIYVLAGNYTNNINETPQSENPKNTAIQAQQFTKTEVKFQLSFKTNVFNNIFGKKIKGGLWLGYTQSSRWQFYNSLLSRPFRETNYEPEAMLIFNTPYKIGILKGVFLGIGLNHQSNGREYPFSRSWNRIVGHIGFEINKLNVIIRPWARIREKFTVDDNPDIEDYIGRGEITLNYNKGHHSFYLTTKHSLIYNGNVKGGIQLDYSLEIYDNLKMHLQFFHGYGESLIDYNHKQTTIGIGFRI